MKSDCGFSFSKMMVFVVLTLFVFLGWLGLQAKWISDRELAMQWALQEPGIAVGDFPGGRAPQVPWQLRMLGHQNEFGQVLFDRNHAKQAAQFHQLYPEFVVRIR